MEVGNNLDTCKIQTNVNNVVNNLVINPLKTETKTKIQQMKKMPHPIRLVMISCVDNCQFCDNPKGEVFVKYLDLDNRYGFLNCKNCNDIADDIVEEWYSTKAWGTANCFRNKNIKIKRSSGDFESDWKLNKQKPFVETIQENDEVVNCIKDDGSIMKYCSISDLFEWNNDI